MQNPTALPDTFGRAAPILATAGRVPLPSFTKAPERAPNRPLPWKQWQTRPITEGELAELIKLVGHAPMTGMVLADTDLVVDIDADDPNLADQLHAAADEHFGATGQVRYGREQRRQLFYSCDAGMRCDALTQWAAIQILRAGKQTIVAGTHPDTGKPYRWTDTADVPWQRSGPYVTADALRAFLQAAREIAPPPKSSANGSTGRTSYFRQLAATRPLTSALAQALAVVVEGDRHNSLVALIGAAVARDMPDADVWQAVREGTRMWTWSVSEVERETERILRDMRSRVTPFISKFNISRPTGPKLSRMARRKLA